MEKDFIKVTVYREFLPGGEAQDLDNEPRLINRTRILQVGPQKIGGGSRIELIDKEIQVREKVEEIDAALRGDKEFAPDLGKVFRQGLKEVGEAGRFLEERLRKVGRDMDEFFKSDRRATPGGPQESENGKKAEDN